VELLQYAEACEALKHAESERCAADPAARDAQCREVLRIGAIESRGDRCELAVFIGHLRGQRQARRDERQLGTENLAKTTRTLAAGHCS